MTDTMNLFPEDTEGLRSLFEAIAYAHGWTYSGDN